MNWFKKQINKFINKEDSEYEYEYEEMYENYDEQTEQHVKEAPASKPKTFRFPLIEDMETSPSPTSTPQPKEAFNQMEDDYYGQIEDLSLPKHLNNHIVDSSVYDVEVSGIRELLANRSKRTGRTTITKSQPEEGYRSKASLVFRDAQNEQPIPKPKENNISPERTVENSMPANRKRFVPSDVPSPVYGFAKPSPIEQLLDKRKEELDKKEFSIPAEPKVLKETTTNQAFENILEEKEPIRPVQQDVSERFEMPDTFETSTKQPITFDEDFSQEISDPNEVVKAELPLPQTTSFAVAFEDQVKEAVQHELDVEQLTADQSEIHVKEVIVEQVQIENSTIHIGEVTVVQPAVNEVIGQEMLEGQSFDAIPKQDRSRIPFNVLMLKTDKEKWRIQQQSKNIKPSTVVEKKQDEQKESSETIVLDDEHPLIPFIQEEIKDAVSTQIIGLELEEEEVTSQQVEKNESSIQNSPINASSDSVSVITMSPVATVSSVSTLEKTAIEIDSRHEISATTDLEATSITEHEYHSENVELLLKEEPVEADDQEQSSNETLEGQEKENPPKPVHVYQKPTDEYLELPEEKTQDTEWMEQQGDTLVEALSYFQVSAQIESIMQGPAVTQFEITVSHGTKVSKIRNLADDLKLALAAKDIRIQAPIPGKSSIGIEIPNRVSRAVRLSEVTNSASFLESESPLEAALGLDLTGKPVTIDLRKMPHGLIAGATGSGKSVCINSILVSLLYKAAPHELKLMLIDPKMVELAPFNHIPHLVSPVITDVKAATAALKWAVEEMERRYQLFAHAGARDITRYNALADKNNEHSLKLPYMLIVIDELADLMMMSPADVEEAICRIAQKARACGIHLIVATQRPSVDVITGLIKSNIPTRIAFAVSSQIDSRTILDGQGAERLLGRGDMLYLGNGMSAPVRLQGTFVTDDEIESIIEHVREQGEPDYIFDQEELLKKTEISAEQDDLFEEVCRFVFEQGGASTSLIQRKYHIGYNRAARLIDMLESHGFVSEARGSKPRESYITEEDLITMFE
ncbi:DNA translocase FtsK [Lysinibacillus sp. NPDC047702]|uniref:DNA translocase FtsK n=1 Tax=unclassified Lysinibacillus TaxID=2636778 RepID=UPI003D07C311